MYNAGMAEAAVTGQVEIWINFNSSTGNSFSNSYVYIPNYTVSTTKNVYIEAAAEGNAIDQILGLVGGLWADNSATNSISATPSSGSFVQHSTATLFGIKKS